MGNQIIRQPDGLLAIFSTNTDTVVMWDATAEDVEEYFVERAAEDARRQVRVLLGHVVGEQPRKAYFQFTMTWAEALEQDRLHGGEAWRCAGGASNGADVDRASGVPADPTARSR